MKNNIFKKLGFISIEIVIISAIVIATGLAGVMSLGTNGSASMKAAWDKVDALGIFGGSGTFTESIEFSSLEGNGVPGLTQTSELTITLNKDIDLEAADITLAGATKGELTDNNDGTYVLAISEITVANGSDLTVSLFKRGYDFTPTSSQSTEAIVMEKAKVTGLTANGTDGLSSTTELTLTLDKDIDLVLEDIVLVGATLDSVTDNDDGTYTLSISNITIANGETLSVSFSKHGYSFSIDSTTIPVVFVDEVNFVSLTANGTFGSTATTQLTIALDKDIDLTIGDITLSGATKDALVDNNDGTYDLTINNITVSNGENVTVSLSKEDHLFTPSEMNVATNKLVTFDSVSANGVFGSETTTELTLTLSEDINLDVADISVTGATKGTLTDHNDGTYTLGLNTITVSNGANLTVGINKDGYSFSNKTVVINKLVTFKSISANGTSFSTTTTTLTLTLSEDINLTLEDITVTGATKVSLNDYNNGTYTLGINAITVGNRESVTVGITKAGYSLSDKSVAINKKVTFDSVSANGAYGLETTTALTLAFSEDIDLTVDDISITGATKGTLTDNNDGTYTLAIINPTIGNGDQFVISVSKSGFAFPNRGVVNNRPVNWLSLSANGYSWQSKTTQLTLQFSGNIGLVADDITVTGATKGSLSYAGNGTYLLGVTYSGLNLGTIDVSVNKPGFNFGSKSTTAYTQITIKNSSQNGSSSNNTSKLYFTLSEAVSLTSADISVSGATKGALTDNGSGSFTLDISDITTIGTSMVHVNIKSLPQGYYVYNIPRVWVSSSNGTSRTTATTEIVMSASHNLSLTPSNFSITCGSYTCGTIASVTNNNNGTYTLGISSWNAYAADSSIVNVNFSWGSYSNSSQTVVYKPFSILGTSVNGSSGTSTTTQITLFLSQDVPYGLTASNITITGASKTGTLSHMGGGRYILGISNITVGNGGIVTVAINKTGWTTPARNVTVWKV